MSPSKLALLINDAYDAIERSKIGPVYHKDEEGNILSAPGGGLMCNMVAVSILQTVLQAQIIKQGIHES